MKNRLHDKKAGIAILISLIVLSLAEIIFRHFFLREMISSTANYAETLAVIILALTILIFTLKGKDRVCYILYGAWIAYFVLDQFFELPAMLVICATLNPTLDIDILGDITLYLHTFSMVAIILIAVILVEYMNDGSIYNRVFNILCVITIVVHLLIICFSSFVAIRDNIVSGFLITFNNLYRLAMVFLFSFFAYDSAKKQLSKVDFSSTK